LPPLPLPVEGIASAYVGRSPLTRSDLIQEGMIGLLSSVYGYNSCGCAEFKTYAHTCVSNRIISAVRNQLRDKHMPLNAYVQIDDVDLTDIHTDPQLILDMQEKMDNLNERIENELTDLEREVLRLHIGGHNYSSIAEELSVSVKSVDNALQRARKKLKEE
jgi:RNA polymerase sporulation-specific sigma factor